MRRLSVALALVIVAAGVLSGCGAHLYNKSNDTMAKSAEKNLQEVQLSTVTAKERERMSSLLQHEIDVIQKQTLATRDAELIRIIGATDDSWSLLQNNIDDRLKNLVNGSTPDETQAFTVAYKVTGKALSQMSSISGTYRVAAAALNIPAKALTCPVKITSPEPTLAGHVENYGQACTDMLKAKAYLISSQSALGKNAARIAETEQNIINEKERLSEQKQLYEADMKKYNEELKNTNDKEVVKKAEELSKYLDYLEKGGQATSDFAFYGKLAALEEQSKTINELVGNFIEASSGDTSKADKETVEAKIGLSLGILNKQFGTRWKEPQLTQLVMMNERLRLQIESLKRKIENLEEELALNKQMLEAGVTEVEYLSDARAFLGTYLKKCEKTVLKDDFIKGAECKPDDKPNEKINARETIARILLLYSNSWTISRVEEGTLNAQLRALRHKVVLDNSDDAIAQWDNLLRVTTSQFAALHGSGITSGDVARFIAALGHVSGLFYIGSQVQ